MRQRKANGVDVSLDAAELEGLSEEELRRKYDSVKGKYKALKAS